MKSLPCCIGLHWWKVDTNTYPTEETLRQQLGTAQIVKEIITFRDCALCKKREVLNHCVWNFNTRRFDTLKDVWSKIDSQKQIVAKKSKTVGRFIDCLVFWNKFKRGR